MASLNRFPHIAEKIFNFIDANDLQDYRSVCKSWQKVIDNPVFWLTKLKKIGQPFNVTKKWQTVISKAKECNVADELISKALVFRYCSLNDLDNFIGNHFWEDLPMITAMKYGSLEIVKLFGEEMNFNFDEKVTHLNIDDFPESDLPIFIAMGYKNFEMVKYIISKMKKPLKDIRNAYGESLFRIAMIFGGLDILKMLVDKNSDFEQIHFELDFAIKYNDFESVKIMLPKVKESKLIQLSNDVARIVERGRVCCQRQPHNVLETAPLQPETNAFIVCVFHK